MATAVAARLQIERRARMLAWGGSAWHLVEFAVAVAAGTLGALGLRSQLSAVRGCRAISKRDMKLNDALPKISVDAETYEVRADGELLTCEPASVLPLAQRYALF